MILLSTIKSNPNNPRVIKDARFKKLVKSIQEFPKMMALRPLVVDADNVVLGGNMRLKALKELGYKEVPQEWVKKATDLTEEEQKRFIIADNVGFGEDDWDMLANEWNLEQLDDWGMERKGKHVSFDVSDKISEKYLIEITCKDESEQEKLFNDLQSKGLQCRILTL